MKKRVVLSGYFGFKTWGEIRRKEKKKEKKKDRLAEVSRRYSSLDELREPALSSSEADEEFSSLLILSCPSGSGKKAR